MGRPKVKIIDDSVLVEEKKASKDKQAKSEDNQSPVLGSQLSDKGSPVVSSPTEKPASENRQQKTDNRKPQKPGKAKPRSKKYQEVVKDLDRSKIYPLNEKAERGGQSGARKVTERASAAALRWATETDRRVQT